MPLGVKVGALKVPVSEKKTGVGSAIPVGPVVPRAGAGAAAAVRSENVGPRIKVAKESLAKPLEAKEAKEAKEVKAAPVKGSIAEAAAMVMAEAASEPVSKLGPRPASVVPVVPVPGSITTAEWKGTA
jgi:hypothetical protein